MSDRDVRLAELWLAFQEGGIASDAWQRLLAEEEGLRRFVRRAREAEMIAAKKLTARQMRIASARSER